MCSRHRLTGMEVRGFRIEGAVQVFEVVLTVNMTSLTIDQIIGKRRKVVSDMCDQLKEAALREANAEEWALLCREVKDERSRGCQSQQLASEAPAAPQAVDAFLSARIMPLAREHPDHYNQNGPLGAAIGEAVLAPSALRTSHLLTS